MGCFSDKTKQMCSKVVIGVSFLIGIISLLTVIFGAMLSGKIPMTPEQQNSFQFKGMGQAKSGAMGIIVIGCVGMLISCLGCFTGKTKNFCFAIPFGLLTFILSIAFLIMTMVLFGLGEKAVQE